MPVTINKLEIENVKRIKAVVIEPTASGLTVIGGRNNQGKTSVLDSIAWALGGETFRPSQAQREGSAIPPNLKITMSNGLIVERKGKNSSLKVTDPSGQKAGQQLLDSFIEKLALNLPKFMQESSREKARTLLQIIGVEEQLAALEKQEKELYNERLAIGRIADRKAKYADEQVWYQDAPEDLVSPSELIRQQQEILARNGENQRKRNQLAALEEKAKQTYSRVKQLEEQLEVAKAEHKVLIHNIGTAQTAAKDLQDESTAELEASIANIEEINRKVRANLDREKAMEDAAEYKRQYDTLTGSIEKVRKDKMSLLNVADLPLPGLSVADGGLVYKGQQWDNMSGSDQLRVATAIVRKLNPECGFVLLDKLEQMDIETLQEFGHWLEQEGLQVIATRVSTGEECSIIIEDGYIAGEAEKSQPAPESKKKWEAGVF